MARSRGAFSGLLLIVLGAWGAIAPFIGPSFDFAFTHDPTWTWTAARGWYEVLPGAVVFVGGILLLLATSRATTLLGAWLGIVGGAWFIVGLPLSAALTLGSLGQPVGSTLAVRVGERLALFSGLGAVILFLASVAFGRLSVVSVRDVRVAERRQAAQAEADELAAREAVEREDAQRRAAADNRFFADQDAADRSYSEQSADGNAAVPAGSGSTGSGSGSTTETRTLPPTDSGYGNDSSYDSGYRGDSGYGGQTRYGTESDTTQSATTQSATRSGYDGDPYGGRHDAGAAESGPGSADQQPSGYPPAPPPPRR